MNTTDIVTFMTNKTPNDAKEVLLNLYAAMTPEQLTKHMRHERDTAMQHGRETEREELVCRLLASGMPVEEVAVVLCLRIEAVRVIRQNNAAILIPQYEKKLKERRKRRERSK